MWQAPDGKRRALAEMQREARERRKRESGFKIRRSSAQVRIGGMPEGPLVMNVRVILNEVAATGMQFFAGRELPTGALAQITLEEPRRVYVRAKIVCSQEITTETRIISTDVFSHRVKVIFLFETEEDQAAFKA